MCQPPEIQFFYIIQYCLEPHCLQYVKGTLLPSAGRCLFLAGTGLKIVVKSHFLNIRVIYTPEQHPMGFSVPRTQAKAVRGVKDKKAGKNCFPQRIFLDHLLTERTQTSVSQLLTDSPQASGVFLCCAASRVCRLCYEARCWHIAQENQPLTLRHVSQVPHFTC